jgi:hypothetical protein
MLLSFNRARSSGDGGVIMQYHNGSKLLVYGVGVIVRQHTCFGCVGNQRKVLQTGCKKPDLWLFYLRQDA